MKFEFDPEKSDANRVKHGIDFIQAQQLWAHDEWVMLRARSQHEKRLLVIGKIEGQFLSAIVAKRQDVLRIISVRRARKEEVAYYEKINIG